MVDSETLFLRKTTSVDDLGGFILDNSNDKKGIEELTVKIRSEESFFSGSSFRAFYVKNTSDRKVYDVKVKVIGGIVPEIGAEEPISGMSLGLLEEAERAKVTDVKSWADYYHLRDFSLSNQKMLQEKFKAKEYPYTDEVREDIYKIFPNADSELLEVSVEYWNNLYLYQLAAYRSSLYNQVSITSIPSSSRVVKTVNEDGVGVKIDLKSSRYYNSLEYSPVADYLAPGEFWGFYLDMKYRFNPQHNYKQDLAFIRISWTEEDGEFRESQLIRVVFNTNYQALTLLHSELVKSLYDSYPVFFGEYEE